MPSIRRLKTRREFLRVAAARRKQVRPGLVLQAARRQDGSSRHGSPAKAPQPAAAPQTVERPPRDERRTIGVGFTASRKVGNAVARNRARRRLRAAAGEVLPRLGEAGTDYVLVARKATLERSYGDLVGDLRDALKRIGYRGTGRADRRGRRAPRSDAAQPPWGERG